MLRRLRTLPREQDERLIEASCERLLSAAPPLGDGPSGAAFLRRASLLLPVLVGQPGEAAGRLLLSICGLAEAESAAPPLPAEQRALLLGAVARVELLAALGFEYRPEAGAAPAGAPRPLGDLIPPLYPPTRLHRLADGRPLCFFKV